MLSRGVEIPVGLNTSDLFVKEGITSCPAFASEPLRGSNTAEHGTFMACAVYGHSGKYGHSPIFKRFRPLNVE